MWGRVGYFDAENVLTHTAVYLDCISDQRIATIKITSQPKRQIVRI